MLDIGMVVTMVMLPGATALVVCAILYWRMETTQKLCEQLVSESYETERSMKALSLLLRDVAEAVRVKASAKPLIKQTAKTPVKTPVKQAAKPPVKPSIKPPIKPKKSVPKKPVVS